MKAQVLKYGSFWFGRVCVKQSTNSKAWKVVTEPCLTRIGATIALNHWLDQHKIYEVN